MVPPTPAPSPRLRRAASAERVELTRHRERLLAARQSLREELSRVESSLQEVDERQILLDRLAGPARLADDPVSASAPEPSGRTGDAPPDAQTRQLLRGPTIRRAAVEVLLSDPRRPEAL